MSRKASLGNWGHPPHASGAWTTHRTSVIAATTCSTWFLTPNRKRGPSHFAIGPRLPPSGASNHGQGHAPVGALAGVLSGFVHGAQSSPVWQES